MSRLEPSAELAAYHEVTVATYRLLAERSGGGVAESPGLVLASGPHPAGAIINVAFRVDSTLPADEALAVTRAHYAPRGYRFALVSSAHRDEDIDAAAAARGWRSVIELPSMVCREPLRALPLPPGATLRPADPRSSRDRAAFGTIVAAAFADEDEEIAAYRRIFMEPELYTNGCAAFLASVDGQDASCAWVAVIGGAATVGWVGTLPAFRRRGLGDRVTRAATNAAFEMAASLSTLQASPEGQPVYARMGYEAISSETLWAPPT